MRYEQLYRVHLTAEALRANRYGMTLEALTADVGERTGIPACERTTRRDCELLETLGLAEHVEGDRGNTPWRWHWRRADAAFLFGQGSPDVDTLRSEILELRTRLAAVTRQLWGIDPKPAAPPHHLAEAS